VADYYDCNQLTINLTTLYGIDVQYYDSNFRSIYIDRFLYDLTGVKGLGRDGKRLYYFKKGEYAPTEMDDTNAGG
jgi:hypothetical protein